MRETILHLVRVGWVVIAVGCVTALISSSKHKTLSICLALGFY